ncbi:hypothetical protein CAAN1_08S04544 [[Candida] anglica]|uniref:Uncharacterized protein n=1 Tax=[Candida] anglica TaxID=148631 RepID=A0ABP0E899_9ASCO
MAPTIPGFFYDEAKKKYFKIVNGSSSQATEKYHNNSVQAEKRRNDFINEQTQKKKNVKKPRKVATLPKQIVKLSEAIRRHRQQIYENNIKGDIVAYKLGAVSKYNVNIDIDIVTAGLKQLKFDREQSRRDGYYDLDHIVIGGQDSGETSVFVSFTPRSMSVTHDNLLQNDESIFWSTPTPIHIDTERRDGSPIDPQCTFPHTSASVTVNNNMLRFSSYSWTDTDQKLQKVLVLNYYKFNRDHPSLIEVTPYTIKLENWIWECDLWQKEPVIGVLTGFEYTQGTDEIVVASSCTPNLLLWGTNKGALIIIPFEIFSHRHFTSLYYCKLSQYEIDLITVSDGVIFVVDIKGIMSIVYDNGHMFQKSDISDGVHPPVEFEANGPKWSLGKVGKVSRIIWFPESSTVVIVGLRKIVKYLVPPQGRPIFIQDYTYLNCNIVNQNSVVVHSSVAQYLLVNESNHELRLINLHDGTNRRIVLDVPRNYILCNMFMTAHQYLWLFYRSGTTSHDVVYKWNKVTGQCCSEVKIRFDQTIFLI